MSSFLEKESNPQITQVIHMLLFTLNMSMEKNKV